MKTKIRAGGIVALATTVALVAAACGGGNEAGGDSTNEPTDAATDATGDTVELTWWHNGTGEPLLSFWQEVADEFAAANPGVTINVEAFQNEELRDTILPNAFAGGTAPDLFQSWGGGELARYHAEDQVKDISSFIPAPVAGAAEAFRIGDGIYGMPYTTLPSGFWVNMNLWEQAGLTDADFPTTLDELFERWQTLKDAGIVPVAVGGVDGWPAAHWWYWTALRSVSPDAMQAAITEGDFSDPGWLDASELLQTVLDQDAFNPGWQATSAQQGAASASGMVVLDQAAMQLMGTWDYGQMGGIFNEANELPEDAQDHAEFLRWFPFPQVEGTAGDPAAIMGGVDGFSVRADAPDEAAEFLAYIVSTDVQKRYAALGNIPVDAGATDAMPAGPLSDAAAAVASASSVQLWLDTALGDGAFNGAIVSFMSGQGTPQDIVDALTELFG
ncbi:extracellular solute-binding protein family 1 [Xylanimonas cellulosilytica DSM 15894]|uniref:Extracellular solute-binding protein family 1 n=1 Tax=Xylanimonas cellulosilytica (strain DSM 15894 / JCM 12276 / CECT 5975 / KCTC 9989 / LMG 20990 / NBRC 107835 / XIL07) TaxID=446471 RepID=D1BXX7_XYLCX|nr:extracellular solute-binding protein [Xylanimonas cellulosilytica]ACZ31768.1 extracellular solute-binding protein family 1 [Xylanimonas cellulosilytica DSM 15894]